MKDCFFQKSFLIIFLLVQFASSMHWATDTELHDLEYSGVEFVAEASHWSCSSLKRPNNNTYNCNGVYYIGGFDVMAQNLNNYFQRIYYTLPAHNQVNISFTLFAMDGWGTTDYMNLKIDGNFIQGFNPSTTDPTISPYATQICGGATSEYPPFTVVFISPHSSTASITIQVIANLNGATTAESLAFRDLVIDFQTVTFPASSKCAISLKPLYVASYACSCPLTNQYPNPVNSGTCSFCDSTCATCSGSAATQCTSCYPYTDRYFSSNQCLLCYTGCATCTGGGQYQCTSCKSGYYLANDGACYTTCDFPLYTLGNTDTVNPLLPDKCLSPCIPTPSTPYLYWDGTCSSTCAFPLSQITLNSYAACKYSCTQSQYLYWNGSCLSTCPYPLSTRVQNHRYFCDHPCYNSSAFLLWDASCSTNCALTHPYLVEVTEGGSIYPKKFCRYPCPPTQYLYWNGSCLNTCPYPLTSRIQNGRLFCDFSCSTTTDFLYWNGSCITSCLPPLSSRSEGTPVRYYCDYPCGVSTNYLYWNGTCSTCFPPLKTRIDNDNKFCDYPCATNEYLYWDGTCQPSTSCNAPLVKDFQGASMTRNFCQYYCGINQYLYWNGSCIDTCDFPLTRRYQNYRQFCDYPCAPTQYLYWNGSCLSSCVTPLTAILEGTPIRMYCRYPCSNNQYLYWNTTCGSCNTPFVRRTEAKKNYCDYPCPTSEWLYWDGSCNTTCNSPLTPVIQGTPSRMLCAYTCGLNQYLYWNGSCADYCTYPLLSGTYAGRNFCYYPCLINQYLYPNRTCASSCSGNFPPRTEANRNYCDYPCSASQFLLYTGVCVDNCPYPYVVNVYSGNQFCDLPCLPSYYWYTDKKACNETCDVPLYYVDNSLPYQRCIPSEIILSRGNLIEAPTKPETVTFLTLVRPMNYMRYLEISMPERLELLAASRGRNILATYFGLEIENSANLSFFKEKLPYVYARHNVQSSFIVNYWKDLITLLIGVGAAALFFIIEKVSFSEGWELIELISRRLRVILMWNYVIMVFAWNIDDLILFAALEYKTIAKQPETPVTTPLSFVLSLFFLALMLGFIYGAYRIIKTRRHLLKIDPNFKKSEYAKKFDLKYENYQIVYRGFKDNSVFNQFFFLIYMFRIGLPMVIAVSAVNNPLVVAIFQLVINIDILLYLFIMRPFKKLINQIQLVSYEIIIFMMNLCVLVLAAKSPTGAGSPSSIRLGDVIIIGNDMINFLAIIFLVIKIYIEALAIHKDLKRLKTVSMKERVTSYLQLLALPLQQDNMGFEEMINYYCPPPKPWFEPLVKRLFRLTMASIASFFGGLYSDCKGLFGTKSAPIAPTHHRKLNNNDPGDLHTYDYEHKMFNRDLQISRPDHDETMNAEVRLINKSVSIMDLTPGYERGNHLDKFVDDEPVSVDQTPPQIEPEPYLQKPKNPAPVPVPPSSLQQNDMSAIGGKGALDNSGLSLEPFLLPPFIPTQGKKTPKLGDQNRPIVKPESPQFEDRNNGLDSESVSDTRNIQMNITNTSNIRKKRGRVNHADLQIDAELAEATYNQPKSGIPDNLSPIAQSGEPHQLGPMSNKQASRKHNENKNNRGIIQEETQFVKKDYTNHEWNKESNETETAFNLDDSFEQKKKNAIKRKKKIRTDFKLSGSPQVEQNKDYVGWTPYNGN